MIKLKRPLNFLDLETTGTSVTTDRIVEIAIKKVYNFEPYECEKYYSLVNPIFPIPKAASDIHNITDEMVKDKPHFKTLAPDILAFLDGTDLAGFNSNSFDFPMLLAEFDRSQIPWDYRKHEMIDVCNIYKQREPRTLAAAVKFYTGADHTGAHGGLADVNGTIACFIAQFGMYGDLPEDMAELALYSNYSRKRLDLAGKFNYNDENKIVFSFGKWANQLCTAHLDYLDWMQSGSADFPLDTKFIAQQIRMKVIN